MPFTTVVPNGGIMTSLRVQILPFYPFEIILGNMKAFHSFSFGDYGTEMYLFPGFLSLLQFFFQS